MKIAIAGIASALALGLGGCASMGSWGGADDAESMSPPASAMTAQPEAASTAQPEQQAAADCPPAGQDPAASGAAGAECPPVQTEPDAATAPPQPQ